MDNETFFRKIFGYLSTQFSKTRLNYLYLLCSVVTLSFSVFGHAIVSYGVTYQGRIIKSDNQPLVANAVDFSLQLIAPRGNCILYSETLRTSMTSGDGTFSVVFGKTKSVDSGDIPFEGLFATNLDFPPLQLLCSRL